MGKKKIGKAVVAGIIVAELAVLDYAAWQMMRNGVEVGVTVADLERAGEVALSDMEGE